MGRLRSGMPKTFGEIGHRHPVGDPGRAGDEDIKSLVIGQAGENLVRYAKRNDRNQEFRRKDWNGSRDGLKKFKGHCCPARPPWTSRSPIPRRRSITTSGSLIKSRVRRSTKTQGTLGTPFYLGSHQLLGWCPNQKTSSNNRCFIVMKLSRKQLMRIAPKPWDLTIWRVALAVRFTAGPSTKILTGPYAGKYDEGPEYTSQGAFCGEPDIPSWKRC